MHDPAHPGEIVREECLKPLGLTVTAAAEALGVTRKALSDLWNGHTGVSPDMAIRLEQVFGSTADTWLRLQLQRDLCCLPC
ncbi:MAG TPA: HigA family addiction module antitoxin [Stellaceae bacterium]|nr:HigA family addiction module antitoxin [Stellaceae bacterium]